MVSQILNQLDCVHPNSNDLAKNFEPGKISMLPPSDAKIKLIQMFNILSNQVFDIRDKCNNSEQ